MIIFNLLKLVNIIIQTKYKQYNNINKKDNIIR